MARIIERERQPGKKRAKAPWPPLAVLVGVAAALWGAAELDQDGAGGGRSLALLRGGTPTAATSRAVAARGGVSFSLCAGERRQNCVIDGDTFKLGDAKYRVTGIGTAEVHAACPAEAAQAEASTKALQGWLSAGAFQITTRLDQPTDRYGRTSALVYVQREGSQESVAHAMLAKGFARVSAHVGERPCADELLARERAAREAKLGGL